MLIKIEAWEQIKLQCVSIQKSDWNSRAKNLFLADFFSLSPKLFNKNSFSILKVPKHCFDFCKA